MRSAKPRQQMHNINQDVKNGKLNPVAYNLQESVLYR